MCQIEYRVAIAHLSHINQHQFIILNHHVLSLKVKMQQSVAGGNSIEDLQQEFNLLLRKIALNMLYLTALMLQGIRHTTVSRHPNIMHLPKEISIFSCQLVYPFGSLLQTSTQGLGM